MSNNNTYAENDLTEVKQLGMWASIISLSYVFWLVGGMELVERLAYYGVKSTASLYAIDPVSNGGLGITMGQYGIIMSIFALVQTFVPVLSGGVSDRIGYKETIVLSTFIKILGYLVMAWFPSFYGFMVGAILLAAGTGIFKPGIQGTLVKATKRENSTMAWGIFYQVVNIGGFLGPVVAAHMRQLSWAHLFYTCAVIISLNLLLVLAYKEPDKEERIERNRKIKSGELKQEFLWKAALIELKKPIVFLYMIVFSGFWFMFNALFDVLPVHIKEWVDTTIIVKDLFGEEGPSAIFTTLMSMDNEGTKILPEGMLNINAAMIMTTCFLFAAMSAKYRITSAMLVGCIFSVIAITFIGAFNFAWMTALSIALFSIGEMLISPKKNEFMGNIAPADKKAMYLGFVMLPQGIGWGIEGYWGPRLYEIFASKENFSRELLAERGMSVESIKAIPNGEAFNTLVTYTGEAGQALTQLLYQTHNIGMAWYIIGAIGSVSGIGIYFYGQWLFNLRKK
jgi:POT family proton-dependent oligopeptide transporter